VEFESHPAKLGAHTQGGDMVEPLHDSRTCPVCQGVIHGRNPRPKAHAKIEQDKGDGLPR